MIRGTIETFAVEGGGTLYRGECVVARETVTAGEVMAAQVPAGPAKGFVRETLRWVDAVGCDGTSRCEFEILDRREPDA